MSKISLNNYLDKIYKAPFEIPDVRVLPQVERMKPGTLLLSLALVGLGLLATATPTSGATIEYKKVCMPDDTIATTCASSHLDGYVEKDLTTGIWTYIWTNYGWGNDDLGKGKVQASISAGPHFDVDTCDYTDSTGCSTSARVSDIVVHCVQGKTTTTPTLIGWIAVAQTQNGACP